MPMEYHTVNFSNDPKGIERKNAYANEMAAQGWRIISESIQAGQIKGSQACCGYVLCAPLAFFAGRKPGQIVTTFGRDTVVCRGCGAHNAPDASFCRSCGRTMKGTQSS